MPAPELASALPQSPTADAMVAGGHHHLPQPPHGAAPLQRATVWGLGVLLILAAAGGLRLWSNARASERLADTTREQRARVVLTVQPRPAGSARSPFLPATLRGSQEAALYARTSGYLKRWTKDIGDSVRAGELLAELEAPEADQELRQARANREQLKARLALAQSSLARHERLLERDAVSAQDLDERRATATQAAAEVAAADANVARLETLQGLRRIVAPFNGVVLRRNTEVGALINSGATTGRELYAMAQIDTLNIDLQVPQALADQVRVGLAVSVRRPERPGAPIEGRINRVAPGLDSSSRNRQVLVELPNPGHLLLPGSYVEVQLGGPAAADPGKAAPAPGTTGPQSTRLLLAPVGVLQFRQDGPRVALVQDGKVNWRSVKIGRDLGREVEITAGISAQDVLVLNPSDALTEGEPVRTQAAPSAPPK